MKKNFQKYSKPSGKGQKSTTNNTANLIKKIPSFSNTET